MNSIRTSANKPAVSKSSKILNLCNPVNFDSSCYQIQLSFFQLSKRESYFATNEVTNYIYYKAGLF